MLTSSSCLSSPSEIDSCAKQTANKLKRAKTPIGITPMTKNYQALFAYMVVIFLKIR